GVDPRQRGIAVAPFEIAVPRQRPLVARELLFVHVAHAWSDAATLRTPDRGDAVHRAERIRSRAEVVGVGMVVVDLFGAVDVELQAVEVTDLPAQRRADLLVRVVDRL